MLPVRLDKRHAGLFRLSPCPLLSGRLLQFGQLSLMEAVDCVLDRQDGVTQTAIALESIFGEDVSSLCGDETVFLQQPHILGHGIHGDSKLVRNGRIADHTLPGSSILDPQQVYIEEQVEIGRDTILYPGVMLRGRTKIGADCVLMGSSRIEDSILADGVELQNSVVVQSEIGSGTTVGPFAYLRPGSKIGSGCKVGDFVEVKNSNVGDGTKLPHLAYIGDADIGRDCNIACGTIFVNYDGKIKQRSTVEDRCFIGCNVNLVAPVAVREGAYVAAGTTVTEEVEAGSMAIGRVRAETKPEWADNRRKQGKLK